MSDKTKAELTEIQESLENLYGLVQSERAKNDAMKYLIGATFDALSDKLPAIREMAQQQLNERYERIKAMEFGPEDAKEADLEATHELISVLKPNRRIVT